MTESDSNLSNLMGHAYKDHVFTPWQKDPSICGLCAKAHGPTTGIGEKMAEGIMVDAPKFVIVTMEGNNFDYRSVGFNEFELAGIARYIQLHSDRKMTIGMVGGDLKEAKDV